MAVVTQVVSSGANKDPEFKMVGIITLEDIIEELIQNHDEDDTTLLKQSGDKLRQKEKLVLLFSDQQQRGNSTLTDAEAQAVCEFLQKQVKVFSQSRMKRKVLLKLLTNDC